MWNDGFHKFATLQYTECIRPIPVDFKWSPLAKCDSVFYHQGACVTLLFLDIQTFRPSPSTGQLLKIQRTDMSSAKQSASMPKSIKFLFGGTAGWVVNERNVVCKVEDVSDTINSTRIAAHCILASRPTYKNGQLMEVWTGRAPPRYSLTELRRRLFWHLLKCSLHINSWLGALSFWCL